MEDINITITGVNVIEVIICDNDTKETKKSNLIECATKYYKNKRVKIRQIVIKYSLCKVEKMLIEMIIQENTDVIGEEINIEGVNKEFLFEAQFLVPYRASGDNTFRKEQLHRFIISLSEYINLYTPYLNYRIIILEQNNHHPFNRELLLNAGYLECERSVDQYVKYYIHHNCDLFPDKSLHIIDYSYTPINIVRDLFKYDSGVSGASVFNSETIKITNGFWGNETRKKYESHNIQTTTNNHNKGFIEGNNQFDFKSNKDKNGIKSCKYSRRKVYSSFSSMSSKIIHYMIDFDYDRF